MDWIVYILRCTDDTLYTGITNNLDQRIAAHDEGKGAKYTRGRGPFEILYTEKVKSRSEATLRERAIKKLDRVQKFKLLTKGPRNSA